MNPLVVTVTFNRLQETTATLASLDETTEIGEIELVIVDNGSTDGTAEFVTAWAAASQAQGRNVTVHPLQYNIGCPKALNLALEVHRRSSQPVVKVDNDVRLLTPGWVSQVRELVEQRVAEGWPVAMVGAYYDGVLNGRLIGMSAWRSKALYAVRPVIGHCVWHTGKFMDAVGYFDVLADDHLYGFEDLILSHKAHRMGWETLTWEGWRIENLQRHSTLGKQQQNEHVEQMRPLYNERVADLTRGLSVRTGLDGKPVDYS